MRRLRHGDWICGVGAVALLVVLIAGDGWSDHGWLAVACCALAIGAGIAVPLLTLVRISPSAPLLAGVAAFLSSLAAAIAILADGVGLELAAALVLAAGAYLGLRDERSPGAPEIPVERRPAPPAGT